jgi:hypothetical protein
MTQGEGDVGEIVLGFNIYRRREAETYQNKPLNPAPIMDSTFEDRTVVFGEPACYVIRGVVLVRVLVEKEAVPVESESSDEEPVDTEPAEAEPAEQELEPEEAEPTEQEPVETELRLLEPLVESADSEEICITPVDTFPPSTPGGLVAVVSPEGILLTWREVETPDLKGYLVYRSKAEGGPFELLSPVPISMAGFTDRETEPGVVYYYVVSTVDQADPWNESPRSRPVSIQAPENP